MGQRAVPDRARVRQPRRTRIDAAGAASAGSRRTTAPIGVVRRRPVGLTRVARLEPIPASHDDDSAPSPSARPPLVVAWEVTRACPLACRHCRATAQHHAHPAELSHAEGSAFIADLAEGFPGAVLILTGGEPLTRADTLELAAAATRSRAPGRALGRRRLAPDTGALRGDPRGRRPRVSFSIHFPDADRSDQLRLHAGLLRGGADGAREPPRGRGPVPAPHERDAGERRVAPCDLRSRDRARRRRLGAVLPRPHRARLRARRRGARTARAGARARLALRPAADARRSR